MTQLVLPLLFVLNAMILAVTILLNDNATDPPRALTNHKSVLSPENITYFWAEFDRPENGSPYGQNYNSFFAAEVIEHLPDISACMCIYCSLENRWAIRIILLTVFFTCTGRLGSQF